MQGKERRRRW